MQTTYRFDPIDLNEMRRWGKLSPGRRIQTMLHARQLAMGLIRGQLRKRYPDLSIQAINLKLMEEIERRARQTIPRF